MKYIILLLLSLLVIVNLEAKPRKHNAKKYHKSIAKRSLSKQGKGTSICLVRMQKLRSK